MKITGLDVPPEHVVAFEKLIAKPSVNGSGTGTARTRRSATRSRALAPREKLQKDILAAVKFLAERIGKVPGSQDSADFIGDQMAKLAQGIFDVAYWRKAEIIESVFITETPTWSIDSAPSPYAYRQEDNMPTIAHYDSGTIGGSVASYTGATDEGYFADAQLTWNRTVYKIDRRKTRKKAEPALIYWETNLAVSANSRGSKPMFSTVLRCYITTEDGEPITTLKNPVVKIPPTAEPNERGCTSLYWRYRIPAGDYPYWHGTIKRTMLKNLPTISTIDEGEGNNRAVVCSAPRPMFGHAFNNNTSVSTTVDSVPDIYQMPKAAPITLQIHNESVPAWNYDFLGFNGYTYEFTWTKEDVQYHNKTVMHVQNGTQLYNYNFQINGKIELPLFTLEFEKLVGEFQQYNLGFGKPVGIRMSGHWMHGYINYDEDEETYTYTLDHVDFYCSSPYATPPAWTDLMSKEFTITRKYYKQEVGKGPELLATETLTGGPVFPFNWFQHFLFE